MKNIQLLLFCLGTCPALAQIQWEHTYPTGELKRVDLDVSGEHYVLRAHNQALGTNFHLFDSTHADIGVSFFPFPPNSYLSYPNGYFISEKIFDDDEEIELAVNWNQDGEDIFGTMLLQENGDKSQVGCLGIRLLEGFNPKFICGSYVYALPGRIFEHQYTGFYSVSRMEFPLEGELFFATKYPSLFDGYHIHDANHQWLKTINPPLKDIQSISQTLFNDDASLEIFGSNQAPSTDANGNDLLFQIFHENGSLLFSVQAEEGYLSSIPNFPTRLLINKYTAPGQLITEVYDVKTFELIHAFSHQVIRAIPDGQKEYYWKLLNDGSNFYINIYDGNTFAVETIPLGPSVKNVGLTRNRFSNSGKWEISVSKELGPGTQNKNVIIQDEDGVILYTFENVIAAFIDRQANMPDKLFVQYTDSTQVYGFLSPNTAVPKEPNIAVSKVYPNPFSHAFEVAFPAPGNFSLEMTDILGRSILRESGINQDKIMVQMPVKTPAGTYFLSIQGKDYLERFTLMMIHKP
jgi:hypothetical protein